jgi:DNA-binding transcriptional ArsR family regulator
MITAGADVYGAIADPTRRRILSLLHGNEMSVSDLAAGFPVTRPAISQHLGVLREAGLVAYRKEGRTRYYRARAEGLTEVIDWLSYFDVFWTQKLGGLAGYLSEGR